MKKSIAAQLLTLTVIFYSCNEEEILSPNTIDIDFIGTGTSLNLRVQYPDSTSYDSAYIIFRNSEIQIKQKLILNNTTYIADGIVTNIAAGNWNNSTSFFRTIISNYE